MCKPSAHLIEYLENQNIQVQDIIHDLPDDLPIHEVLDEEGSMEKSEEKTESVPTPTVSSAPVAPSLEVSATPKVETAVPQMIASTPVAQPAATPAATPVAVSVQPAVVSFVAQKCFDGIAHLISEKHFTWVFFQHEPCANLVPIVIGVFQLVTLGTAQKAGVGLGQQCRVADGVVTSLMLKDLFITSQHLVLPVMGHFAERYLVFAVVCPDINDWRDNAEGQLVKAFHHLQLFKKQKITVIAAVFLQFLILEHIDEAQFQQLHDVIAVQVNGILDKKDILLQKVFIISVFIAIFSQPFHLFDEEFVQSFGTDGVDGDLSLRKKAEKKR